MSSDCDPILAIIRIVLGKTHAPGPVSEDDVERAFRHLKWCRACRSSLSDDDRVNFLTNAILERE